MCYEFQNLCKICCLTLVMALQANCASTKPQLELPPLLEQQRIRDLNHSILALGEDIDASEAQRAARISIEYTRQLAHEYEISSSPVFHNLLVNLGVKPRGLCVHWTSDLLTRLQQEQFHSLDLHWGIANYETTFRLEHSTVIISARGNSLYQGLVLDPWRQGGELFWSNTLEDSSYQWKPQAEIHARKRERRDAGEIRQFSR
ncbi:MAG: hypothetical protein GY935_07045 [Gammaproteobacteria bacterium]|nr:hypothetical protein [Gammaproteobacteria bacterium]